MKLKSNIHLKKLTAFLQEKYPKYVFYPDTSLDLIEIITLKNAKEHREDPENVLMINDDNTVYLMYKEENKVILSMEKEARDFMREASEDSEKEIIDNTQIFFKLC